MTKRISKVTIADIRLLRVAIDDAEGWRGSLHPDDWDEFDERISLMRRALKRVEHDRTELRSRLEPND